MNKEIVMWQMIVGVIATAFILVIRESVHDRLEMEAEIEISKCIANAHKADTGNGYCYDILKYKK